MHGGPSWRGKMKRKILSLGFAALLLSAFVGCAPVEQEAGGDSQEAITGSLAKSRACSTKSAYEQAKGLPVMVLTELPGSVQDSVREIEQREFPAGHPKAVGSLEVVNVGTVYVVEHAVTVPDTKPPNNVTFSYTDFFDKAGVRLLRQR